MELYQYYVQTRESDLRSFILLHNRDDLLQLSRLLRILDKLDLHRIMADIGFCIRSGEKRLLVQAWSIHSRQLHAAGRMRNITLDYMSFQPSCQVNCSAKNETFSLTLPLTEEQGYLFVDLEAIQSECFSIDWGGLIEDPFCESGYLIVQTPDGSNYAQVNLLLKKILTEILTELC